MDSRTISFLDAIREGGALLEHAGVPCVALFYPYPDFLTERYPFKGLHELFADHCERQGFLVVDLLPDLSRLAPGDFWVAETDHHPDGLGHRVIAGALADAIRERFGEGLGRL